MTSNKHIPQTLRHIKYLEVKMRIKNSKYDFVNVVKCINENRKKYIIIIRKKYSNINIFI